MVPLVQISLGFDEQVHDFQVVVLRCELQGRVTTLEAEAMCQRRVGQVIVPDYGPGSDY